LALRDPSPTPFSLKILINKDLALDLLFLEALVPGANPFVFSGLIWGIILKIYVLSALKIRRTAGFQGRSELSKERCQLPALGRGEKSPGVGPRVFSTASIVMGVSRSAAPVKAQPYL